MYVFQYRYGRDKWFSRTLTLENLLNGFRKENKSRPVTRFRRELLYTYPDQTPDGLSRLPSCIVGCKCKLSGDSIEMVRYNGLVLLEVNGLPETHTAIEVRARAAAVPQTLSAFIGSAGKSVKIIVRFLLPDGSLPRGDDEVKRFHAGAYEQAVKLYQPWLGYPVTLKEPLPFRSFRLTYDPDIYYNPEATPVYIPQPESLSSITGIRLDDNLPKPLPEQLFSGMDQSLKTARLFAVALRESIREAGTKDRNALFVRLSQHCFRAGIAEEEAIRLLMLYDDLQPYQKDIRPVFRTSYLLKKGFGETLPLTGVEKLIYETEEFMKRRYDFWNNRMSGEIEYRNRSLTDFIFHVVEEADLHSILMEAHKEGINCWGKDIERYIFSRQVPEYHPLESYLSVLPDPDGRDYIRELARRVPNDNPYWEDYFHIWFLGMVALWMQREPEHGNSTTPLLVGPQGCGKSTFCRNLLPPELRMYYTDSVDFGKRREIERSLNGYALINIDEFDAIRASQQSYLKHVLQKASVNIRLPYKKGTGILRRHASFIATSNTIDLLTDPTGSRRFICAEISRRIDNTTAIDYQNLYAQALGEILSGERFWFTEEEERNINQQNMRFRQLPAEEQFFTRYFRIPEADERGEFLLAVEILERIRLRNKQFRYTPTMVRNIGRRLNGLHAVVKRSKHGTYYFVEEVEN